jgi:hypothetical protein
MSKQINGQVRQVLKKKHSTSQKALIQISESRNEGFSHAGVTTFYHPRKKNEAHWQAFYPYDNPF